MASDPGTPSEPSASTRSELNALDTAPSSSAVGAARGFARVVGLAVMFIAIVAVLAVGIPWLIELVWR